MTPPYSLLRPAAENLGSHLRGKPALLWRRPDPTPRLEAVSGVTGPALSAALASLRRRHRRSAAFELAGFFVNLLAAAGLALAAWEAPAPTVIALGAGVAGVLALHFGVLARARILRTRRGFGAGPLHPWEARLVDIAVTPGGIHAAGPRGRADTARFEHLHAIAIDAPEGADGDHAVRFLLKGKDGPSTFVGASRVDEGSARALVAALRGRFHAFEGEGARFAAELAARTVVLAPEAFAAARAAVEQGRYPSLDEGASAAVARDLAA